MSEPVQYAVIDGATEEGLLDFFSEHNPPHCCLYAEPLQPELVPLAPYLVEVTSEVALWLANKTTPWGIYVFTSAVMKNLRHHLRKYLQVIIPSEEKPVFFRFYDPRNIWDFCRVLSEWELHCFMGPMDKIATAYDGVTREDNFQSAREPFPKMMQNRMKLFKLNQSQLDSLNQYAEERYIERLISATLTRYEEKIKHEPADLSVGDLVRECYYFCKEQGIEDDRSIRGMLHLLIEKDIYSLAKLPMTWRQMLSNESLPGYFRVESLLNEVLGYIPH
ncbi:DUF4123 domain-containing protein [Lonsdalea quercina]|uniref:DUF4123 domain-containing protein n=1 Tax=Lonsdalea quercina TaxID=71657 RepID=UPI0039754C02